MAEMTELAIYRHKKNGMLYALSGGEDLYRLGDSAEAIDMREVEVFRSLDDGALWVRFDDGRFELTASLPIPATAA